MSAITNAPRITCRRPKTVAQAKREAETLRPCPNCEYCGQPKTWDTTRYIKGWTFMNRDACVSCYENSNDGYEWDLNDEEYESCNDCGYNHHPNSHCPIGKRRELFERWVVDEEQFERMRLEQDKE